MERKRKVTKPPGAPDNEKWVEAEETAKKWGGNFGTVISWKFREEDF